MAEITVLRPDMAAPPARSVVLAPRGELPPRPVIGLVVNGKPLAAELLTVLAGELAKRLGRPFEIELLTKPAAGYPMLDDEATQLAARSHLVITGLGD
jgi:hypothetical protein